MQDTSLNYSSVSGNIYSFPAPFREIFFTIHVQNVQKEYAVTKIIAT